MNRKKLPKTRARNFGRSRRGAPREMDRSQRHTLSQLILFANCFQETIFGDFVINLAKAYRCRLLWCLKHQFRKLPGELFNELFKKSFRKLLFLWKPLLGASLIIDWMKKILKSDLLRSKWRFEKFLRNFEKVRAPRLCENHMDKRWRSRSPWCVRNDRIFLLAIFVSCVTHW